jgi:hypothetical protein
MDTAPSFKTWLSRQTGMAEAGRLQSLDSELLTWKFPGFEETTP